MPEFRQHVRVVPNATHHYVRRVMDDLICERQADYADLRDTEMRKIVRDCERERGANSLNLSEADWSPAFETIERKPATWAAIPIVLVLMFALYAII